MKTAILAFFLVTLSLPAAARQAKFWSFQEMLDKSDFVVFAKPGATKDTAEKTTLPNIMPDVHVVGVETEFEVSAVLKGSKDIKKLLLHHYRLADPKELLMDGPTLCDLAHDNYHSFLLFLVRESDGRYAPVGGQIDPANESVLRLHGGPR